MQKKSIRSIEEIDDGSTMSFSEYLSQELGTPGTEKRKANDKLLEATRMMMILKEMPKKEIKELKAKLKIIKAKIDKNVYCKKCKESIIGDKYRCVDSNFKIIKDEFLCSKCYTNVLPF